MRKINRVLIQEPNNLNCLNKEQLAHLLDHKKITGTIYRHQDVKDALDFLYYDKCYICECSVKNSYEVEHYRPKKEFPQLGYTWRNLHKSCPTCNKAKNGDDFKIFTNGVVTDMKLLDPSDINYDIEEYILFNVNNEVESNDIGTDASVTLKATKTISYLNNDTIISKRRKAAHSLLLSFCQELSSLKKRMIEISQNLTTYSCPVDQIQMHEDRLILNELSKLNTLYLKDSAEYSTCTRVSFIFATNLTYQEIQNIITTLRRNLL